MSDTVKVSNLRLKDDDGNIQEIRSLTDGDIAKINTAFSDIEQLKETTGSYGSTHLTSKWYETAPEETALVTNELALSPATNLLGD